MEYKIKRELKRLGDKQFAEDIKRYLKSPYEFYGVRVPELRTMAKHLHEDNSFRLPCIHLQDFHHSRNPQL